jgi:hypothetical protein
VTSHRVRNRQTDVGPRSEFTWPSSRHAKLAGPPEAKRLAKSPRNQFKPWTPSDVAELQAFVDEEMTVEEIARELGRTVDAVRAKASEEGIRLSLDTADDESDE